MQPIDVVILIAAIAIVGGVIALQIVRKKQGKTGCCDCSSSCSSCTSCASCSACKGSCGGMSCEPKKDKKQE